jgi:hypothetical protein
MTVHTNRFRTLKTLLAGVMLISGTAVAQQVSTDVAIHLEDSNTDPRGVRDLNFGVNAGATYGIDDGAEETTDLGEVKLPPFPPTGPFEARFIPDPDGLFRGLEGTEGAQKDYRPFTSITQRDTFLIKIQPGRTGSTVHWPVRVTWDMSYVAQHYASATIAGGDIDVNMREAGELTVTKSSQTSLMIITEGPRNEPSSVEETSEAEISHLENHPNPVSGTSTIRYRLQKTSTVTLLLSDISGREIARPIDGLRQEAGPHSLVFDAGSLPEGTYISTVIVDGVSMSRMMTVVR